ncbi:MAG: phosphopantetheine adenylyltransferase [Euryarchaeota archaeon]|jgi:pantetheine-phosphate adenylyltransferase|nr:phosphopantetheine adenylyltransferase [Euryarchaeota archaeon]
MTCVAIGGTFDVLHDGHKALLKKAHTLGDVIIGLVSDEMAGEKIHVVNTYNSRKKSLIAYIETLTGAPPLIIALSDPYGPALEKKFDYIVVSPDTHAAAEQINALRLQRGLPLITIVCVDFVLAQDGKPISSTRIHNGEIDEHGVLL